MSNPFAPEGQDPWNRGDNQGANPGSAPSYGQPDPNGAYYAPGQQGGYVDQTQQFGQSQFQPGYGAQGGYVDQTQQFGQSQFQPGYGAQNQQFGADGYPGQYGQYGVGQPEQKKSKLPFIVAGVAGVLVVVLIAVGAIIYMKGGDNPTPDPTASGSTASPTAGPTNSPTAGPTNSPAPSPTNTSGPSSGKLSVDFKDGVHLEVTKVEKGPVDADGSNTLLVTYSMTNNSKEQQSNILKMPSLKQKGIMMNSTIFESGKEPAGYNLWDALSVTLKPGESKTFMDAYKLPYDNEPVTFSVVDFDDFDRQIPDWVWTP